MGRWTESDRSVVDELISEWRESCLIDGLSLLRPGETIWTPDNFSVLMEKFVAPEVDDARTFEEKLVEQLDGVGLGPANLMAEVIAIYLAFASPSTIGGERKSEVVAVPLSVIGEDLPEDGLVANAMWGGHRRPWPVFQPRTPVLHQVPSSVRQRTHGREGRAPA